MTPRQEKFCLAYLETSNASEAYRRSYSWENMSAATVNRSAKDVFDNPKVRARIKELHESAATAAQMTLEGHLNDLQRLRDKAEGKEKYSAAVAAEISRGKAAGFYVEKLDIRHSFAQMSDAELDARITELEEQLGRITHQDS